MERTTAKKSVKKPLPKRTRREPIPKEPKQRVSDLDAAIIGWQENKKMADQFAAQAEVHYAEALAIVTKSGKEMKGYRVALPDNRTVSVTLVQGFTEVLNEEKLKRRLGVLWRKVTSTVLDRDKLKACIKSGEVDAHDVAACTSSVPRKAFLKGTVH